MTWRWMVAAAIVLTALLFTVQSRPRQGLSPEQSTLIQDAHGQREIARKFLAEEHAPLHVEPISSPAPEPKNQVPPVSAVKAPKSDPRERVMRQFMRSGLTRTLKGAPQDIGLSEAQIQEIVEGLLEIYVETFKEKDAQESEDPMGKLKTFVQSKLSEFQWKQLQTWIEDQNAKALDAGVRESLKRLDAYLDLTEVQKASIHGVLKAEFDAKRETISDFILMPGTTLSVRFEWTLERVSQVEAVLNPDQRKKFSKLREASPYLEILLRR